MAFASIIIPVYNAETTLKKCVESLVFGTFRDIKIILVDDCSSDNSWAVCRDLHKKYSNVFCIQNEQNKGVSYSRNQGLSYIEGKYVLFVDSDDWVSGNYVEKMICIAEKYPDSLAICGIHFHENVEGYRYDFIWQEESDDFSIVPKNRFFKLLDSFMLPQIWNKLFRRDIIENNNICFDVSQKMGEDFQFVLDYMETAQIQQCVVLNEPLYYYIRSNDTSLMSKFGLIENSNVEKRLRQLLGISGKNEQTIQQFEKALSDSKKNAVYQAVHYHKWNKEEKLNYIEKVISDGHASKHYREQYHIYIKEILVKRLAYAMHLFPRAKAKVARYRRDKLAARMRKKREEKDISIISQNCIGGVFYHDMGMQFLSPTINLFFKCPDFMKFVLNLDYYLDLDLRMTWGEEYPVGYLDDVTIYFQHYETCSEAEKKWNERKIRINRDKIVVLCTDMEDFTNETYEQWKKILFPKLLFSAIDRADPNEVFFPEYEKQGKVSDLIPDRKFYRDGKLMDLVNGIN